MIEYVTIQQAMAQGSGEVNIRGWVYRERGSNKFKFIVLRDTTNIIQCVIDKEVVGEDKFKVAKGTQIETSMGITGEIKAEPRAPSGYEVHVKDFEVYCASDTFPINKDQSPEFLLDKRHLWIRSRKMQAILKIRNTVFKAIREYFDKGGFYEFHTPIFQPIQCEGGSSLFKVDYFGEETYLAQTWQLYAEAGIFTLEKIYTISPSFRAEKSKTSRHLTEYWHAEMEGAWLTFKEIQDYGEGLVKHVFGKVLETNINELEILKRDVSKLKPIVEKPFIRMTYTDVLKLLKEKANLDIEWGKDLRTVEEDELSKLHDVPIIVTNYPKKVKAFYMKEDEGDKTVVHGYDLIATESYGEIIGGSERESDIEKIKSRLNEEGEDLKNYEFYLDTRRYGSVPHGGFGLGVERLITWICGLDNIKDSIPFPRTIIRYKP